MRKLTNKDIARIVKQWLKGKPITKIAEFFQVTRQRVHQIIKKFRETGEIPFLRKPGRKPKEIDEETGKNHPRSPQTVQPRANSLGKEDRGSLWDPYPSQHHIQNLTQTWFGGGEHEEEKAEKVG